MDTQANTFQTSTFANRQRLTRAGWLAGVLLTAAVAGCNSNDHHDHDPLFSDKDEAHDLKRLIETQNDNGAVADGTLYGCHFTGPGLNSLGVQKLDMMLAHDGALPMTVYLSVPEDGLAQGRRMAVGQYLEQRGLKTEEIKFAMGPNPSAMGDASSAMKGLSDLDAAAPAGAAAGGSSSSTDAGTMK